MSHCFKFFRTVATFALLTPLPLLAFNPNTGDLSKDNPDYVRVLVYNLERNWIGGGTADEIATFDRIMLAVDPDIICLQEVIDTTSSINDIEPHLNNLLGGSWESNTGSANFIKNAIISRYPFIRDGNDSVPASSTRSLTWALIDLPDETYNTDIYGISVHFKAGGSVSDEEQRQDSADAASNWFADLTTAGGNDTLPNNTPIFLTGDTNVRDTPPIRTEQPWQTILTGDIIDNNQYGADRPGDWDGTGFAEFFPRDVYTLDSDTHPSRQNSPTNRLDRFAYSDSVMEVAQAFVLNTASMNATQLAVNNFNQFDTDVSDHYPLVFDLVVDGVELNEPGYGDIIFTEVMPDPSLVPDSDGEYFELHNWTNDDVDLSSYLFFNSSSGGGTFDFFPESSSIRSGDYNVYVRNANPAENGEINVDGTFTNSFLANSGDSLELWRGSIKIDGIRYGSGPIGDAPENILWSQTVPTAQSIFMDGDLSMGRTDVFGFSETQYNAIDRGTPGEPNTGLFFFPQDVWIWE